MMQRRIRIVLLAVAAVLLGVAAAPRNAYAVYSCGGVNDTCSCGQANFCICCNWGSGLSGNCVWYAWHMACCKWGENLPFCTNAETWDNYASSNGYPVRTSEPCKDTVFVCEKNTSYCGSGGYGHVGWVDTAYANGSVDVREQGCYSWNGVRSRHFDAQYASPAMKYIYKPGTSCGSCECTPGQSQSQACGNCGTRSRTCLSSCQWGAWSACNGQGACSPGSSESRACCDCGTQSRSCSSSCAWTSWSECSGPDPDGGNEACDTGEIGLCGEGRVRCVNGCRACAPTYEPGPELCDAIDNDCNDEIDEGAPLVMGDSPPPFAAKLLDYSFPQFLSAGSRAEVWAVFENVGSEAWPARQVWLVPANSAEGELSGLHDETTWETWNVAAIVAEDVPPGGTAVLRFSVAASGETEGTVSERFRLQDPNGTLLACPTPEVEVRLTVENDRDHQGEPGIGSGPGEEPALSGGCSTNGENRGAASAWCALLLAGLCCTGRRRRALRRRA